MSTEDEVLVMWAARALRGNFNSIETVEYMIIYWGASRKQAEALVRSAQNLIARESSKRQGTK